jgi:transposase
VAAPSRAEPAARPSGGRRKLREVWGGDAFPIAEEGLRRIAELYEIEAEIRGQGADARLAVRARVSAKSRVGEKLGYFARHWDGLILFLTDGQIEMDINPARNAIRPLTLNRSEEDRKSVQWMLFPTNAFFAGHDEGGRALARRASLIETAKMNGLEPFSWLTATLEAISAGHAARRIDELLPWNFKPRSS